MEKVINMNGTDVKLKCTAATPMKYRMLFGTDMFQDVMKFQGMQGGPEAQMSGMSGGLEVMNQMCYAMAKQADPGIADFEEWLDQFGMADIMMHAGDILELWGENMQTGAKAKKKPGE